MTTRRNGYEATLSAGMALAMGGAANGLPEGWKITEFAAPPQGEYPAANGDVYISSDRNGSLGKDPKFGKIVRATDTGGDVADEKLTLVTGFTGRVSEIKRSAVKKEKAMPQSMMPPGLGSTLSIGEFTDLIEHVVSLKNVGG